jgi:hypothetical protein
MPQTYTRQEIYDLVWSEPTRTVANRHGISDVALAKTCRKANIPIPPRGYWARIEAGQRIPTTPLPPRFPGAPESFEIGSDSNPWRAISCQEILDMPVPPVPMYSESIEAVTARVEKMIGKVPVMRDFSKAFGPISRLLAHDDERRNSQWASDKPKYEGGIERRRLLILNSIFLAVSALGCRPSMSVSKYGVDDLQSRGITVTCGAQHVHFTLEPPVLRGRYGRPDPDASTLTLLAGLPGHRPAPEDFVWKDNGADKVEHHLREIVVSLLVTAEVQHREHAASYRQWIIDRKEGIRKELEREKAEKIRKEQEVKERREKKQIAALVQQASDLQTADAIRAYVRSMLSRSAHPGVLPDKLKAWAEWALEQADRIDPSKSDEFLNLMDE